MQWKGRPIRQYQLPPGEWSYDVRFALVRTARYWGLTPSQFDALSEQDKAETIACYQIDMLMAAVEADEREATV